MILLSSISVVIHPCKESRMIVCWDCSDTYDKRKHNKKKGILFVSSFLLFLGLIFFLSFLFSFFHSSPYFSLWHFGLFVTDSIQSCPVIMTPWGEGRTREKASLCEGSLVLEEDTEHLRIVIADCSSLRIPILLPS